MLAPVGLAPHNRAVSTNDTGKDGDGNDNDASGRTGGVIVKGVLLGLGAIVLVSFALSLFKLAMVALVVGGVGYVGLRALGSGKELPKGDSPRQLSSNIQDRMEELDKLDKKLDEQLAALSKDRKT